MRRPCGQQGGGLLFSLLAGVVRPEKRGPSAAMAPWESQASSPSCGGRGDGAGVWAGGGAVWAQELPHLGSWLQDEMKERAPRCCGWWGRCASGGGGGRREEGGAGTVWRPWGWIVRSHTRAGRNWWSQGRGALSRDTAPRPGQTQSTGHGASTAPGVSRAQGRMGLVR